MTQIRLDETFHYEFDDAEMNTMLLEDEAMNMSMEELANVLDSLTPEDRGLWDIYYHAYVLKEEEENRRYFEENYEAFKKYEDECKEKAAKNLPWAKSFYSDWHKDMYGHRPRYEWMRGGEELL